MSDLEDDIPENDKNATEEANFIILLVMLHEKPVSIEYMLVDVQRQRTVEKLDNRAKERRGCTGLDIGAYTSLC